MKLDEKQRRLSLLRAIEDAEQFVESGRFTDLDRGCAHDRFVAMAKSGREVSDNLVQHIHDRQVNHFGATADSLGDFLAQKNRFDEEIWPVLQPRLKQNSGLAQFMLEHGVDSDYVARFLYDVQRAQGVSILLGHGIGHTVMDELEAVTPTDNAFAFYHDASFGIFRFRAKEAQAQMRQARRILFLGCGADPALYVRQYPLGKLEQTIVAYDHDAQMQKYLQRILGAPLAEFGIDYRIAEIEAVLSDASQYGQYDLICMHGIAAYYEDRSEVLFDGVFNLLAPGGKLTFDVQCFHPVLAFDVAVLGWPTTMHVEPTLDAAQKVSQNYCRAAGLQVVSCKVEDVPKSVGMPAGVVTLAQKAEE